jgi:hypothetical protein
MERIPEEKTTRSVESLLEGLVTTTAKDEPPPYEPGSDEDTSDEGYYLKALEYIRQTGRFSTSVLQRRFKIGYQKAGRITDMLEERGIIGPMRSGGAREILVDLNAEDRMKMAGTDGEAAAFDTRTSAAEEGNPFAAEPTPDTVETSAPMAEAPSMEPMADYSDTPFNDGVAPSATDDFDLGDFDPSSLELPEIRRPSQV